MEIGTLGKSLIIETKNHLLLVGIYLLKPFSFELNKDFFNIVFLRLNFRLCWNGKAKAEITKKLYDLNKELESEEY